MALLRFLGLLISFHCTSQRQSRRCRHNSLWADCSVVVLQDVQVQEEPKLDGLVEPIGFEGNRDAAVFAEVRPDHALERFRERVFAGICILVPQFPAVASFVENFPGRSAERQIHDPRSIVGPCPGHTVNDPISICRRNLADHPGRGRAIDGRPLWKTVGDRAARGGAFFRGDVSMRVSSCCK